jgi:hypothetical protein
MNIGSNGWKTKNFGFLTIRVFKKKSKAQGYLGFKKNNK